MPWHWPRSSLHDVQSGGNPLSLNVMGVHHSIVQGEVIELVHVRFSQTTVSDPVRMDILHSGEFPMPEDLKKHISALESRGPTSLRQVDAINKLVAASTVSAIKQFAKQQRFSLDDDVDLIGSSGLLVSNEADDPPDDLPADNDPLTDKNDNDSTELGDLSIIAAKTTKTTIGTFRDSALASGLPPDSVSYTFDTVLDDDSVDENEADTIVDCARRPLSVAFATFEGCVGRPLSYSDKDENERMAMVGHVQSGDNFFEVRRKVGKFWGECPGDVEGPTRQVVVDCEG